MTTACSQDTGVRRTPDGGAQAIPCENPATVRVRYRGVERPMCAEHADSFCQHRPAAVLLPLEEEA